MRRHLVSVGDLVLDLILPASLPIRAGEHQHTDLLRAESGGAGNLMIAARRLDLDVSAIGTVGDDAFGAQVLALLRAEGIHTGGIAIPARSATTVVVVLTDQVSGEHVFVGHRGAGPVIDASEETAALVASADAVFVSGFALADARTKALALTSMAQARQASIPLYFDPGPMLPREQPDLARRAADDADVVLLTADEAALLELSAKVSQKTRVMVVKEGVRGCTIVSTDGVRHVGGFKSTVVDTVGAGDCFDAAFIAARLQGWSLDDAALLANAAGAASVRKVGAGTNAPTRAEIDTVLAEAGLALRCPHKG